MRIAIISERWASQADEGMLNFLRFMSASLQRHNEVLAVYSQGDSPSDLRSEQLKMGKGLVSRELLGILNEFDPELTFYVPTACATLNALYRGRRLERAIPRSKFSLISLQRRDYGLLSRALLPLLRPNHLVVISSENCEYYRDLGFRVENISVGVDLNLFHPVEAGIKEYLRHRHGLPLDRKVILHVGHLGTRRGLHLLEELASGGSFHVVLVASTATEADLALQGQLRRAGVDLRHEYISNVAEIYQASDGYLFPVENPRGSIEFPLSVLEAMACNLPILTTRFGGVAEAFVEGGGLKFVEEKVDITHQARELLKGSCSTREAVLDYSWDVVFDSLMETLSDESIS